jgi:hypothetical protein
MKRFVTSAAAMAVTLGLAGNAGAVNQIIGDVDGFGFATTAGLVRATAAPHTTAADTDGDGFLEAGEFLPDLNRDGAVAVTSSDDFDHRSAAELAATSGAQLTDRSMTPAGASHNATFVFTFTVPVLGDDDHGVDHFINFVFGDYEVVPASLDIDGTVVLLTAQTGGQDGLIQFASATVPWSAMTDGEVVIKVLAPNEPYLAFDYALLDTDQIADRDGDGIPDSNDNCPDDANTDQGDADGDQAGDACDLCALDAANDLDTDGLCGDVDNCPGVANADQADLDQDGVGDACDTCTDVDADGVCDDVDACEGTVYPESVPTVELGVNRWVLGPGGGFITRSPNGHGPDRSYTIEQTRGCSCAQIIVDMGLGEGHRKFGCSISAMDEWIASFTPP